MGQIGLLGRKKGEGLGNIGFRMGKKMISDAIGYRDADEVLKKAMVSGRARVSDG